MTAAAGSLQVVPQSPPSAPALRAADQGVADALESVLSDNTRRVYGTHVVHFTAALYKHQLRYERVPCMAALSESVMQRSKPYPIDIDPSRASEFLLGTRLFRVGLVGSSASCNRASSSRRRVSSPIESIASNWSHRAISSSTLATMRYCSVKGGRATGIRSILFFGRPPRPAPVCSSNMKA